MRRFNRRKTEMGRCFWRLRRRDDRAHALVLVFFIATIVFWSGIFSASAQSIQQLNEKIVDVRMAASQNTSEILSIRAEVARNSSDIRAIVATQNDLSAAINKLSGIGIAIGALGSIIFIFQSVTLVQKRRDATR